MPVAVSNRYARALADVVPAADYRQVQGELEEFAAALSESSDLREVMETPAVPMEKKLKVLAAVAERRGASRLTLNFLRVLARNYRLRLLDEIRAAFRNLADARLGVVRVKITSARELSSGQRELLRARFHQLTQKQAELEFRLDPELIGGVVAQVGSTVYDGSIRGQLERIREQLSAQ